MILQHFLPIVIQDRIYEQIMSEEKHRDRSVNESTYMR